MFLTKLLWVKGISVKFLLRLFWSVSVPFVKIQNNFFTNTFESDHSSNPGWSCLHLLSTNSPWEIMGQTGFSSYGTITSLREEKPWIQTSCTPLKNWPHVTSCHFGRYLLFLTFFFFFQKFLSLRNLSMYMSYLPLVLIVLMSFKIMLTSLKPPYLRCRLHHLNENQNKRRGSLWHSG